MSISLEEKRILPLIEPEHDVAEETAKRLTGLEERLERISLDIKTLQDLVEGYSASLSLYEARVSGLEAFQRAAAMIGSWKSQTCIYSENGVCKLWRLSREAAKQLGEEYVTQDGQVYRVVVSKAPWFCGLCPLYRAKEAKR